MGIFIARLSVEAQSTGQARLVYTVCCILTTACQICNTILASLWSHQLAGKLGHIPGIRFPWEVTAGVISIGELVLLVIPAITPYS
jgi:hypothetical protein